MSTNPKEKICWTHYVHPEKNVGKPEHSNGYVVGVHHDTLRHRKMYVPNDVKLKTCCIRTFGESPNLKKMPGDMGPNKEGFHFYYNRSYSDFEREKEHGVYVISVVNHEHSSFLKTLKLVAYSYELLVTVFKRIYEKLNFEKVLNIVDVKVSNILGTVQLMAEFGNVADYQRFIENYLNFEHDYMPHNIEERVTTEMRASEALGIRYSQLPEAKDLDEIILSWDIECFANTTKTRMPSGDLENDRLQLLVATVFRGIVPETSYCLLYTPRGCDADKSKELELNVKKTYTHSIVVESYKEEIEIIKRFVKLIKKIQPTVILSYNGSGFDTPFIVKKAAPHILNDTYLSKYLKTRYLAAKVFNDAKRYDLYFPPCVTSDLFLELRAQAQSDFRNENIDENTNYSLNFFAQKVLGEKKVEMSENVVEITRRVAKILGYGLEPTKKDWTSDNRILIEFITYCIKDTILPVRISMRLQTIQTKRRQAHLLSCPASSMFTGGITQQMPFTARTQYVVRKIPVVPTFELLCAAPSDAGFKIYLICRYYKNNYGVKRPYEGAIVVAVKGKESQVICMDFGSLYPNSIRERNISLETAITRPKQLELFEHSTMHFSRPNGEKVTMYTRTDVEGIIPTIMGNLLTERSEVKKQIKAFQKTLGQRPASAEEKQTLSMLNTRQLACKLVANSGYGACAAGNTIMTCLEVAEKTTAVARSMFVQINEGIKNLKTRKRTCDDSEMKCPKKIRKHEKQCERLQTNFTSLSSSSSTRQLNRSQKSDSKITDYFITDKSKNSIIQNTCSFKQEQPINRSIPSRNMRIIYGDTDSIMISNVSEKDISALTKAIHASIKNTFPKGFINLEYEYYTSCMVVVRPKKYCYVHPDDVTENVPEDEKRIVAKGLKSVRGDTIPFIKEFDRGIQKRLIFDNCNDIENILLDYCKDTISSLPARRLKEFIIKQKVKSISEYKNLQLPQVVAYKQKLTEGYEHIPGDKIAYIIVTNDKPDTVLRVFQRVKYFDTCSTAMETLVSDAKNTKYDIFIPYYVNCIIKSACNWLHYESRPERKLFVDQIFQHASSIFNFNFNKNKPAFQLDNKHVGTYPEPVDQKDHIYYPLLEIVMETQ